MSPSRLLTAVLWAIIFVLILPLYLRIAFVDPVDFYQGGIGAGDFKAYYIAAQLLRDGQPIYDPVLQDNAGIALGFAPDQVYYVYPSVLAHLLLPLSRVSIETAARYWNGLNLVLLVGSLALLTRSFALRQRLGRHYPWLIILFALAAPVFSALRIGQANIWLLFLLAAMVYFYRDGRLGLAGSALALATVIKIFPAALLLWFLWRREYRVLVAFGGTWVAVLGLNALILAAGGRDWLLDWHYFTRVLPQVGPPRQRDNQALAGFLSRFALPEMERLLLLAGFSLVIVGVTAVSTWRVRLAIHERYTYWLALWLPALLLVGGITWTTTLILLLIPYVVLLVVALDGNGRLRPLLLLLVMSYGLVNGVRLLSGASVAFEGSPWLMALPFYGLVVVWGTAVIASRLL
ncbi:MAG: DUF2029 domain-containing protein [Anaerolineales bacterium]|nr:DUF2029 domain-containing protein [Anaerolineales bacterium]